MSDPGWILNLDSAPFCNGSLHLGHVRNYVLGDIRARWLRMHGAAVHYYTQLDAFGIPHESAAAGRGMTTAAYVDSQARLMVAQLRRLRLSYSHVGFRRTCDPGYFRWTQWLLLRMWQAGLVYADTRPSNFCPSCGTFLATAQCPDGACWRCGGDTESRSSRQLFVRTTDYAERLRRGESDLHGWSKTGRRLLSNAILEDDWMISRDARWGTPIPAVDCSVCGIVPVSTDELPIRHEDPEKTTCAGCGRESTRLRNTLDCFFDDAWCFWAGGRSWTAVDENPFEIWSDDPPREVHFHAGYDAFTYLQVFRFVGRFLYDVGFSPREEPIDFYHGHGVVTADGRKMSKRYGNAPDLDDLLDQYGIDVVRVAVVGRANPNKPVDWSSDLLDLGSRVVRAVERLKQKVNPPSVDAAMAPLAVVDRFIEEYRVASAVDWLYVLTTRLNNSHGLDQSLARAVLKYWELIVP